MFFALYISKMVEDIMDLFMTGFSVALVVSATTDSLNVLSTILSIGVLTLAGFFWVIRNKREIQQYHGNSVWRAFKSLFKKWNNYGDKGETN